MDRSELADSIRVIWAEALGVHIDDDTDYFTVGGHSFLALQILTRIDIALGTRLPLRTLFDYPRFGDFVVAVGKEVEAAG